MKKVLFLLPVLAIMVSFLATNVFVALPAGATDLKTEIGTNMKGVGDKGFGDASMPGDNPGKLQNTVGNIIKIVLGFLGIVMVIIVVYAGFLWMTAGGESDQVKKAKDWMLNATIGLLITIAAYTISGFIIGKIFEATTGA